MIAPLNIEYNFPLGIRIRFCADRLPETLESKAFIIFNVFYLFTLQPNTSPSPPSTYLHKSSLIPLRRGSPALDVKPFHPLDLVPHALHQAAAELSAFSPIEARQSCPFRVVRSIGRQVGRQQAQGQPLL